MRSIAPLSALALLFAVSPAAAANWYGGSATPVVDATTIDAVAAIRQHLGSRSSELGIDGVELEHDKLVDAAKGPRIVRFRQTHGGVPVLGGGVAVRVAKGGFVRAISVDVASDLVVDPVPNMDATAAEESLEEQLGRLVTDAEKSELVVLRIDGGRLAWQLDVREGPGGMRYWVDAHDGSVLMNRSLAVHADGLVFLQNSVETPTPSQELLPQLDVAEPQRLNGWGGLLTVANYESGGSQMGFQLVQNVGPSDGTNFLYQPDQTGSITDEFAQVNLYYHLTTVRDLFRELGAPVNDAGWKLTAVANAREGNMGLNNAFFSQMGQSADFPAPNLIAIGQGPTIDFAYDSDVFKHEFGHYVSHNAFGYNLGQAYFDELGISPWSGSIDEGIADYFACSDNDDAELGEASLEPLNSGRNLADISATCPENILGEVHVDGEIIGSFGWTLREEFGKEVGDRLVWGAMSTLMPGGDFDDFAQGILATAEELVGEELLVQGDIATIEAKLAERGLDRCGRIQPLAKGDESTALVIGLDLLGQVIGGSCAQAQEFGVSLPTLFHYSVTPEAGDTGVKISAVVVPDSPGDLEYTIYARAGNPVRFSTNGFLPEVSQFNYESTSTSAAAELVIDANSDPPFDPAETYDFVLVSKSCPNLQVTFSTSDIDPPSEGGGGAGGGSEGGGGSDEGGGGGTSDGSDEDDDGCGCKTAGGEGSPWAPALLALGISIAALRRRRNA